MKALELDGPLEGGTCPLWIYGMRMRPAGLGTYPTEPRRWVTIWKGRDMGGRHYYNMLGYDFPLTEKQVHDFELDCFGCHDCEVVAGMEEDAE